MKYPTTIGNSIYNNWTEEQRNKKLKNHCHGNFSECLSYIHAINGYTEE